MAMKPQIHIKKGGYYEDRMGKLVGPMQPNPDPATREDYPWTAKVAGARPRLYTEDGWFYKDHKQSHADLIDVSVPPNGRRPKRLKSGSIKIRYPKERNYHVEGQATQSRI